jgi:hypothetical protein
MMKRFRPLLSNFNLRRFKLGYQVGRQTVRLSLSNLYKKKGDKYAHLAGMGLHSFTSELTSSNSRTHS